MRLPAFPTVSDSPDLTLRVEHKLTNLGSLRGRLGSALGDGLVYVTGGYAFGTQESEILIEPCNREISSHETLSGWTMGAGFAFKLTQRLALQGLYS